MGDGRGCHHVGGAGADGAGAGHHAPAVARLGKGNGRMGHGLFVMGAVCRQRVANLGQRLAKSCDIAMAEDRKDAGEERLFLAIDKVHCAAI